MQEGQNHDTTADKIVSPFSDAKEHPFEKKTKTGTAIITASLLVVALVVLGGYFARAYLNDPLRTLEVFPISKYFDNYHTLAGSRFKADLRVENDLGWKENVGRLMVFSEQNEPRPIVVMIPPSMGQIYFEKGQSFRTELEVKEGGIIYALSCTKN